MPADGRELKLSVGAEERAALAALLALTSVDRLDVAFKAVRFKGGMRVTGQLDAQIEQPSVISLVPVKQVISEPIDRVFLPTGEKHFAESVDAEIFVDVEGEDVPDHFDGQEADLSDLIVETLSLAVEPYPKSAGESVEDLGITGDEPPESAFAKLRDLKIDRGPSEKG
jgi:hypothetical protein